MPWKLAGLIDSISWHSFLDSNALLDFWNLCTDDPSLCVTMLPKTLKDLPLETGKDMFRAKTDAVKMVVHLRAPEVGFSRPGNVLTPHWKCSHMYMPILLFSSSHTLTSADSSPFFAVCCWDWFSALNRDKVLFSYQGISFPCVWPLSTQQFTKQKKAGSYG